MDSIKKIIKSEVDAFMSEYFEWAEDVHAYLTELLYEHYMLGYSEGWEDGHDSGLTVGYDQGHVDGCDSVSVAGLGSVDGD